METREVLETLYAIELLEYHNKNWLSVVCGTNPKVWSQRKQELLKAALATEDKE